MINILIIAVLGGMRPSDRRLRRRDRVRAGAELRDRLIRVSASASTS
jgi:hypothetical protein